MKKIIIVLFLILVSCSKEKNETKTFSDKETIVYKITTSDANLTSLDVYPVVNSTLGKPVVVWVHGGSWAGGDKTYKIAEKQKFFNNQNCVLVSVNYRLSPSPYQVNNSSRIKHPIHINDVADALKWVYKNINQYGGDNTKISLIGFSAGAHLVGLLGTNEKLLSERNIPRTSIKGVIALDTHFDIVNAISLGIEKDLYLNTFTSDTNIQKDASPSHQLAENPVNKWLFVTRDSGAELLVNQFKTELEDKGATTDVVSLNGYSHLEVEGLITDTSNPILSNKIIEFLKP